MARGPDVPVALGDRVLAFLILIAGGTFVAAVLWLLLGGR